MRWHLKPSCLSTWFEQDNVRLQTGERAVLGLSISWLSREADDHKFRCSGGGLGLASFINRQVSKDYCEHPAEEIAGFGYFSDCKKDCR